LGASVALVEKYGQLGGHTNATSAMIPAAGTSFQKEKDIPDNPEIFMSNVIKRNNGICDLNQVRALCYASSDLVEWLRYECGISLELVLDFNYTGHTYYRMHTTPTV
jgi:fumarate reductase flavoprotein subunit